MGSWGPPRAISSAACWTRCASRTERPPSSRRARGLDAPPHAPPRRPSLPGPDQARKRRAQLARGPGAMAEPPLHGRRELRDRLAAARWTENRIVPEPARARRLLGNRAAPDALCHGEDAPWIGQREHAPVARGARGRRDAAEEAQHLRVVRLIPPMPPRKPRRAHPGRAAELVHLEPRVVGDREPPGRPRDRPGFRNRIGLERPSALPHGDARELGQRTPVDPRHPEQPAQLPQLMGVGRGEHDLDHHGWECSALRGGGCGFRFRRAGRASGAEAQ